MTITGSRQVGKSTEVFKLTKEMGSYYVLLDILNRRETLEDPEFFIQQSENSFIADEIQYALI